MRPRIRFLTDELVDRIVDEAMDILCKLGVELHNPDLLAVLADHGADVDEARKRVVFTRDLIDDALDSVPQSFELYDARGERTHELGGDNVHFTPGSAALNLLDFESGEIRKPQTADYVAYVKVVSQLEHIASQSTAMIPADVPEKAQDSYRLFLSLLYGSKPVVTGTFTIAAFEVMKDMLVAARGSERALADKPLSIFSCCPTSPLKWSDVTSQNVVDCARYSIPIELIAMPLSGFMAPVTLVGTLVAHTAETPSGIVLSQISRAGAPVLYGGSPAIFDVRYETTPMGAVETMMIDCAYNEIGKRLGLPTQAYISLSDAKQLDAQAGLESSMGATLAGLAGINNVSGPGMLDFESCQSLEKLVLDNEICGMVGRLLQGITPKDDFPALPHFEELLREQHLLISDHSRRYLREEHYFPGAVIDRANRPRWQAEGARTLGERAHARVGELLASYEPVPLPEETATELVALMTSEVRRHGQEKLPERPR
ncbi:MAG: trimethylamine methyltransferase family protein [Acidobacteriota bacterium]|jgi:trimethylamine--corrinoid protein Co-methyltransferase